MTNEERREHGGPSWERARRAGPWMIADAIIIGVAYALSFVIRSISAQPDPLLATYFVIYAGLVTGVLNYLLGVYHRVWDQTSGRSVVILLGVALASTAITVTTTLLLTPRPMPLSVVLVANGLIFFGSTALRYRERLVSGLGWRWRAIWRNEFPDNERVLIVGAGQVGRSLAMRMRQGRERERYRLVGFIDDDPLKYDLIIEETRVLGTREDIERLTEEKKIDLIILAIYNITGQEFRDILQRCQQTKAKIQVVPDAFASLRSHQALPLVRDVQPQDLIGRGIVSKDNNVDLTPIRERVILITGAAGSIGSELSRQMAEQAPTTLLILDNNESALHDLHIDIRMRHPALDVQPVLADVTRIEMLRPLFEQYRPQIIFHAAAYKHVPMLEAYPDEAVRVNVLGTRLVAQLAEEWGAERFVLISTDKAVNPSSVMGASKRLGELLIHALSQRGSGRTRYAAVRFGNVLGSRGSVVPTFTRQLDEGGPLTVTHEEMTRYFMSISEAVNLVINAACLTEGNEIFVLRMGEVVRIMDVAQRMIRLRGLRPNVDVEIKIVGMRPGEKLHEELHDEREEPADTAHPFIFKLTQWLDVQEPAAFFAHVDELLAESLADYPDPLQRILDTGGIRRASAALTQANGVHPGATPETV